MPELVRRRAARVIVVDVAARVLLMQGCDPADPGERYWFTPGGGLEPGESMTDAATRELREETGFAASPTDFGEPVWHDVSVFPFEGRVYEQSQDFFLLRTPGFDAAPLGFEEHESRSVTGLRWWSLDELKVTHETFYPPVLIWLVRALIAR
ncbi:MAG TPA: NUDIX domain-containing protein [Mycobacteriales bacterium]|nr:NUDIX domain-containing protein [Mycobacteriales bacterium]